MKNQLYLIAKTVRLTCTWAPTGDAKMPLRRVWTTAKPPAVSTAASKNESVSVHRCA
ncbi:MAG: hypothetical protein ABSF16_15905 [Terracidiphilus sp.]|jgi:hypothetical protein